VIEKIRRFWDEFVYDDVQAAKSPPGTEAFYAELEAYRQQRLDYLSDLVDFGGYQGKRVLEVGCRIGLDLARFARNGALVTGIDLSESCIETARHYFSLHGLEGELLVMDGEELGLEDGRFDLVYAFGVVQYTAAPQRMLGEMHRALGEGGEAIVMVYNRYSWLSLLSTLSRKNLVHEEAPAFWPFSVGQLREALRAFSEVEIHRERFPVQTGLHHGLAARLYYGLFVQAFNQLPRSWVDSFGAHLIARARR
jgi:SAM-dependent methyltransferase